MYTGTPPLEALKTIMSIAAGHKLEFSLMYVDVSRAYFHAKAQRLVPVKLPVADCSGKDKGNTGTGKPKMHNEIGKGIWGIGVTSWGAVHEVCFASRKKETSF